MHLYRIVEFIAVGLTFVHFFLLRLQLLIVTEIALDSHTRQAHEWRPSSCTVLSRRSVEAPTFETQAFMSRPSREMLVRAIFSGLCVCSYAYLADDSNILVDVSFLFLY